MRSFKLLILLCSLTSAWGCASKPHNQVIKTPDITQLTIDQIAPAVTLNLPSTQPAEQVSPEALQLYAEARDALLNNRKQESVEKLNAAIALDLHSSVLYRDLGYAWFGTDNSRAFSAFKRASELDPYDVELHAQVGRLYAIQGKIDDAIHELRIARITPGYQTNTLDAAVVDLLLGRLLNERGYLTASADSLERLLPVIERKSVDMRRWIELYELAKTPSKVRLTIADLSVRIGRFDRAIELYEQVMRDEPAIAPTIELRIIQTRMRRGDTDAASAKMLELVHRFDATRTSVQSYIDLFADQGGDLASLKSLRKNVPENLRNHTTMRILEARLLRRLTHFDQAIKVIDQPDTKATFPAVRELVMCYRDAGKNSELPVRLMWLMRDQPSSWSSIWRGWEILSQDVQPDPISTDVLLHLSVPPELEPARMLVAARIALKDHQKVISRQLLDKAIALDEKMVKQWATDQIMQFVPDVDAGSPLDLARYIDEFSNDPQYLQMSIEHLVKLGQVAPVTSALQAAVGRNPKNVVALTQLVALLTFAERKTEAIKAIEDSSAAVASSPEIYQLAMLASQLDERALCERLLRRSVSINPNHASSANDLGYILVDSGRELDFAENLLWRAVGQQPGNGAFLDSLGWMLYKRGQFNQAALYLEKAISNSDPIDPVVLDHTGDTYHRLQIVDKARDLWQKAVDQIKNSPDSSDPQLRLQLEQKLRQLTSGEPASVSPTLDEQLQQQTSQK